MFKQILGKLPKKPSSAKFWDNGESQAPDNNNTQGDGVLSQRSSNGDNNLDSVPVEVLPRLKDVSISEKQELFLKKLRLCCVVFDFVAEPQRNLKEKEIKRQTLLEVVDYVISSSGNNGKFPEPVIQEAARMVSANLFSNPHQQWKNKTPAEAAGDLEEQEEGSLNPSWPHLQIVYEFLLRLVASPNTDAKISKKYIDHTFVLKLLDLFDSEDLREREYLKTILHRIYGRFMVHRPFIRKTMNNIFLWRKTLARKVEAVNPTKEPLKSDLLNGKWELIYTTSASILQAKKPKFLRSVTNYQSINVDTLKVQNMETWPFFNSVTGDIRPLNSRKVAVQLKVFKILGLIPVNAPETARGELEITYVDEELRLSRGDKGNLFILKMFDPTYRIPL
ncbi:hypothetical protein Bca52824_068566 [Brassica carinata]|uniref:Plastid lipid-associated protein/fibrillin conserved domain-containing protein n=1 Tax=Brassica carinata TaxID=52824 RepID=A0A8X7Q1U1_BRACI|nr:hypothetical protein Bca52824_068566 [Brassica carinata]